MVGTWQDSYCVKGSLQHCCSLLLLLAPHHSSLPSLTLTAPALRPAPKSRGSRSRVMSSGAVSPGLLLLGWNREETREQNGFVNTSIRGGRHACSSNQRHSTLDTSLPAQVKDLELNEAKHKSNPHPYPQTPRITLRDLLLLTSNPGAPCTCVCAFAHMWTYRRWWTMRIKGSKDHASSINKHSRT